MSPNPDRSPFHLTPGAALRLGIVGLVLIGGAVWSWPLLTNPDQATQTIALLEAVYHQGNYTEAVLWTGFAIGFGWKAREGKESQRKVRTIAAGNFFLFGLSDIVEVQTGGWWKPWWLFLWKATCILIMVWVLVSYLRERSHPE
ncbi:MAG: hypothetical protein SFW36_24000 [Leptolyngbyaceae cyanobacterium bins.59]|nr:hypothetical protein [Leptolyngbyaceae cyanobacterium bins.59]